MPIEISTSIDAAAPTASLMPVPAMGDPETVPDIPAPQPEVEVPAPPPIETPDFAPEAPPITEPPSTPSMPVARAGS